MGPCGGQSKGPASGVVRRAVGGLAPGSSLVAPNVATLSALVKALGPEQLPGRVPFILAESVAHGVRLRSFELLQLASRLEEVRTDVSTFAVRDDVREAAAGCLWYMARFSVADQAKGRKALRRLQRLAGERPPPRRLLEQCG